MIHFIRGRFAPSPTGPLHLGSLAAALASYLMAKSQDGQWIIRIEDLDPPREIAGMAEQQLRSLSRFGLTSDLAVVHQSTRSELYDTILTRLLQQDLAFYCACTRSQLREQHGIHRFCVQSASSKKSSIRLKVPAQTMHFNDLLSGQHAQNLLSNVGDVVLKRTDGFYAYQLAVVVDDAEQSITQVVRGADLLDSTGRQIYLQQQCNFPQPSYAHIALIRNNTGQKLSKSQWAADLSNEDAFNAFVLAYAHLGQNTAFLQRNFSMQRNLDLAVQNFSQQSLSETTTRALIETPLTHSTL